MKNRIAFLLLAGVLAAAPAEAVILYGAGNTANLTDPGTGLPFDSVAMVMDGGGGTSGSAVYLGDGYMLTANHVNPVSTVSFDGLTTFTVDLTFAPVQIGTTDMKVFKLTTTPTVAAVELYSGTNEGSAVGNLVGWGVGRDPAVPAETAAVAWGDGSTVDKRWGINTIESVVNLTGGGYSYQGLETNLGSTTGSPAGLGADEAAATLFDSGSGLFQEIGGTWYLTGLTTGVEDGSFGTSTFGDDEIGGGTANYFVRISTYRSEILDAMSLAIPEVHTAMLLGLSGAFVFLRRRN